jgi:excisionase family DNA binding protein
MSIPPARPIQLHTVPEVADQLKVSQKQVRRWIASGDLIAHRLGRQLRIADSDLRAFLAQRRIV